MKEPAEEPIPPLPVRGANDNRAARAAGESGHSDHCTDLVLLERIAAGLRVPEPSSRPHIQQEIDAVITRYRARQRRDH